MGAEPIFKDVNFYMIGNIDSEIQQLLSKNGAKKDSYLSQMVTHAICDDISQDDYSQAVELFEVPVVSSQWVTMSVKCGYKLPLDAFDLEKYQLFSGMIFCVSQITAADYNVLWPLVKIYGGGCQRRLDRSVSHLVCTHPSGAKYERATKLADKLKIITPDWITDSISAKERKCEKIYHPKLLIFEKPKAAEKNVVPPSDDLKMRGVFNMDEVESLQSDTKVALAKMVHNRIHAGYRISEMQESIPMPSSQTFLPFEAHKTTLKNIINSSPRSPGRAGSEKVKDLLASMSPRKQGNQQLSCMIEPTYYGHDPTEQVPEDMCLLGCVFYITDYKRILTTKEMEIWLKSIKQYGGQIDFSYNNRITHLLCENQKSDIFQLAIHDTILQALNDGKRVVTAHWLNDCLVEKCMKPPWKALHVPSIYGDNKPCDQQIISITNFNNEDRLKLKYMVAAIGATYTGYLTAANSALVCKRPVGAKYEKAKDKRIPIVNAQWINDLVLGQLDALKLPLQSRYQQFGSKDDFLIDRVRIRHLLKGWLQPVKINKDTIKRFKPGSLLSKMTNSDVVNGKRKEPDEHNDCEPASKRARLTPTSDLDAIIDDCISKGCEESDRLALPKGVPCVLLTGFSRDVIPDLSQKIEKLGGVVVSKAFGATHLVASQVARTGKFLTAISTVRHIVTPDWIERSSVKGSFDDESLYALNDEKAESLYGINLADSIRRARCYPLFKDMTFYITPSTDPGVPLLKEVITSAGGEVVSRRPSARKIASKLTPRGFPAFVVIGCDDDRHILLDLFRHRLPVYNAEFVLTGVLRQELDYTIFHLKPGYP